jgi:hypothetical protein
VEKPLSLAQVSEEVIKKAKKKKILKELLEHIKRPDGIDIEHYISLLEALRIRKYDVMADELRKLFCATIQEGVAPENVLIEPKIEMALLQMHNAIPTEETLSGVISLNYDSLLDHAFNKINEGIDYGIKCKCPTGEYRIRTDHEAIPLIKLHGSFNWRRSFPYITIDEAQTGLNPQTEMLWIPPSVGKVRDSYPFNALWGRAFEVLDCDILRIVGCKLSQNDWGLISLLFSTQLRSDEAYKIELVNSQERGLEIRERTKFLRNVTVLHELEGCIDIARYGTENVFESWLKSKISFLQEKNLCNGTEGLNYVNKLMGAVA